MIRKNKKFIDPRYFMDEKMELNEAAPGEDRFAGVNSPEALKWHKDVSTAIAQLTHIPGNIAFAMTGRTSAHDPGLDRTLGHYARGPEDPAHPAPDPQEVKDLQELAIQRLEEIRGPYKALVSSEIIRTLWTSNRYKQAMAGVEPWIRTDPDRAIDNTINAVKGAATNPGAYFGMINKWTSYEKGADETNFEVTNATRRSEGPPVKSWGDRQWYPRKIKDEKEQEIY
jgi:hypothetical protein